MFAPHHRQNKVAVSKLKAPCRNCLPCEKQSCNLEPSEEQANLITEAAAVAKMQKRDIGGSPSRPRSDHPSLTIIQWGGIPNCMLDYCTVIHVQLGVSPPEIPPFLYIVRCLGGGPPPLKGGGIRIISPMVAVII